MNVFEALMMICFGVSWPVAILKTWQSKNPAGKSLMFSVIIELGYFCGIINKFYNGVDWVVWLYIINTIMVGIDMILVLYYRYQNRKLIK